MTRSPLGSQKSVKQRANETEKRLAQDLGGHRVPNSGSIDGLKGDVSTDDFLLDSKETGSRQLIVTGQMISKITNEAREAGKEPGLVLTIGQVPLGVPRQWVCVPLHVFQEMISDESSA